MCRTQQAMDDTSAQRIVDVAVGCFFERGFAATTIREIAAGADVPVARLYAHHPSKRALLREIVNAGYDALIAQTVAALADAPPTPPARLDAVVWAHSDFHARHARASFVSQTEARNLPAEDRARIAVKRRRLEDVLARILADGVGQGYFRVKDVSAVSRALLTMCAAIPSWYDPAGSQTPRRVARTYCELAARMAGQRGRDAAEAAVLPGMALGSAA